MVRHGESENNLIASTLAEAGGVTIDEAYSSQRWLAQRHDDPALTEKGQHEAEQLASFYAPVFGELGCKARIYPSPFLRELFLGLRVAGQSACCAVLCAVVIRLRPQLGLRQSAHLRLQAAPYGAVNWLSLTRQYSDPRTAQVPVNLPGRL
jgi:hypothetical protein